jgi:predicted Fe-Mo cluster-binding NifX family protein
MKKTLFSTLIVLSLVQVMAYAAEKDAANIAVASNDKNAMSSISSRAGRCPYYLIFSSTGKLIEVIENPYGDVRGGAGPSMANLLAEKGVTTVIAEAFGGKMINAMKSRGVTYFECKGIANDAVKKILDQKPGGSRP